MVEWCPKCNAQLPPGTAKCPRCGYILRRTPSGKYTLRDIFTLSAVIVGILLIPLLIFIGIVWLIFLR